jgi:hypothetical protein
MCAKNFAVKVVRPVNKNVRTDAFTVNVKTNVEFLVVHVKSRAPGAVSTRNAIKNAVKRVIEIFAIRFVLKNLNANIPALEFVVKMFKILIIGKIKIVNFFCYLRRALPYPLQNLP